MFAKNDRVESTKLAIINGVFKNKKYGTVVGFSRYSYFPRIVIDGQKTPLTYAPEFWKKNNQLTAERQ